MPSGTSLRGASAGLSAARLLSAVALALCTGCSGPNLTFRGQGAEAAGPAERKGDPVSTGSIGKPPKNFGRDLDDEDWRRAHAAMSVALDPQGNGKPVKWENPDTTMRGMVSPTGLPYVANDEVCRDFLASVIAPQRSRFVRGTGCRPAGGAWWLKRLRSAKEPAKEPESRARGARA